MFINSWHSHRQHKYLLSSIFIGLFSQHVEDKDGGGVNGGFDGGGLGFGGKVAAMA